jgi:hypothetical protein
LVQKDSEAKPRVVFVPKLKTMTPINLLAYSGNPATGDYVHTWNTACMAQAVPGTRFAKWAIDCQPWVENALKLNPQIGEGILLKFTAGFPNWGAAGRGRIEDLYTGDFPYPNGLVEVALYFIVDLDMKFTPPRRGGGGRRAPGHALFRIG